jgi:hypothetical protein
MVNSPNVVNKHQNTFIREMLFHQPHKIRLLNPLTKTLNGTFEAQMPSMIVKSVAVMKSPTMAFICTGYPNEIAWVDKSSLTKDIDVED